MNRHAAWALALTSLFAIMFPAFLLGAPAWAQEVTEDPDRVTDPVFDTAETGRYGTEASEMLRRYNELDRLIAEKEDNFQIDAERDAYRAERQEIDDSYEAVVANFANARLRAIEDHGSLDQPLPEWERETSALRSLEAYAAGELGEYDDTTEAVSNELEGHEAQVEELRAAQAAPEEPAAGDGEAAADTGGGLIAAIGSFISGLIGFVFAMLVFTPFALGAMFVLAWRREGDAGAAGRSVMRPPRVALAVGIAFLLWLVGDFFFFAVLALAAAFFWLWRREGSAGGAWARISGMLSRSEAPEPRSPQHQHPQHRPPPGPTVGGSGDQDHRSYLEKYTRDVTQEARDGLIDEAVGREDELEALVEILTRRKINNVVLTGEAGVGKTALVEELARKLVMGRVPPVLAGKELLELNVTALGAIQGVGDLGERLGGVLDELKAEPDRYIVFVDEMHMLMGAGAHRDNPSGAADILKPALARGQVRMIGATTNDEFREIEKDPAMARRFGKVDIPPLTVEETVEVLRRTAPAEEKHYGIRVEDGALTAAAKLADRYVTDQKLPGSAVAVLATACSGVALRGGNAVTAEAVARVVSRQTGVPLGSLNDDERNRVANVEEGLKQRVVGQYEAVSAVAAAIRRKRGGFGQGRPASLMFVGPTGVGKTELAKALAEVLFGDETAMVRLDMSEYNGYGSSWKLLGSDKGYKGSESGGALTEPVRRKPYSVVLLDEVEKAHPDVLNPLLSILDDGRATDGEGRLVDFSNTIVIMTSNLAADAVMRAWAVGQEVSEEQMAEELVARGMRPELVQRIGKIAVFEPPDPSDVKAIARKMLSKTSASMAEEHGVEVSFADEAVDLLAERGYDPQNGLRPLRRVIEREVEDHLTDLVLENKVGRGDAIEVAVKPDGTLNARPARRSQARRR